jgi:uncharacterized membrane protein YeaQ/YmgE (transglycosylase-associated protein family)
MSGDGLHFLPITRVCRFATSELFSGGERPGDAKPTKSGPEPSGTGPLFWGKSNLDIKKKGSVARDVLRTVTELWSILKIVCPGECQMSFLAWIVLGLVAGFIGSKIVNKAGEGIFLDIVLGIVGAVVGGWLFSTFGASGVTGLNLYSLLVAVIGAVLFLFVYHKIRRVV